MLQTTCIISDASRISSAEPVSMCPWRSQPSAAPTSTGLIATGRLRGRTAASHAPQGPGWATRAVAGELADEVAVEVAVGCGDDDVMVRF
jgi:hypothetical protein